MKQLPTSWFPYLWSEMEKEYMKDIQSFLEQESLAWKTIYPGVKDIFNAFEYTSFEDIRVVILGQDPYHGQDQAHGLSFSVPTWMKIPPSLRNIYKELENEFWSRNTSDNGNLEPWTKQWVLLLNSVLTVEAWKPASHSKIWWQNFTDEVIKTISDKKTWVVFLLWWAFAIWKQELINSEKHLILTSPHPSPFSAYKWFFGNMHFKMVNEHLKKQGWVEIKW